MAEMRLGTSADRPGDDGLAVYVTLGAEPWRRTLGYTVVRSEAVGAPNTLRRLDEDPDPAMFSWLDELLSGGKTPAGDHLCRPTSSLRTLYVWTSNADSCSTRARTALLAGRAQSAAPPRKRARSPPAGPASAADLA
jgi:hypothetical protein